MFNSILYKLHSEGLIEKIDNNKWIPKQNSKHEKILSLLREEKEPVPTLQLAKHVYGKSGKTSDINPDLYSLQKQGLINVIKNEKGAGPRWVISEPKEDTKKEHEGAEFLKALKKLCPVETYNKMFAQHNDDILYVRDKDGREYVCHKSVVYSN